MKAKRLFTFLNASITLFVAASCNHKEEMEPTYDPGAVVFNVSSQAISDHGIDVVVRHNGKERDGWNGFLTEDLTSPIEDLILAQAVPVSKKDFHFGTSQTIRLTNLEAEKDYRYIAYGIKDDKTIYGIPGYAVFTTAEDFNIVVFKVEIEEVTGHEAHFKVTHNGKDSYTWYAFATQDMESAIEDLVSAKSEEALDLLNRGASVSASLLELPADTEFRYIVFGIKENGAVYGTPAEVTFKTLEDFDGIQFTAKAGNITRSSAEITVSHDGREDYTWFGFLTEDLETSAAGLIKEQAASVTEADIQSGKDVKITVEDLEEGVTYRYIVTGYKDGAVYGKPGDAQFTVAADSRTPYEKWLGKWSATGSDGTVMNFEITEKVTDQTYIISGFGESAPLEAGFDAETGDLQLIYQQAGSNSNWQFYLAGIGTNDYVAYGDNDKGILGTVKLTGEGTATGVGNEYDYTFSDGSTDHYIVSWIGILGYGQRSDGSTGWVTFNNVTYHYFPSQWIQTESGGDDGGEGGGEASEAYQQWIGSWSIPATELEFNEDTGALEGEHSATHTWVISAKETNASYTITGVDNGDFGDLTATFDAATGNLVVTPQLTLESTYSGNPDLYYFCGMYYDGDSEYLEYHDTYTLFTASISGNQATVTPGDRNGTSFHAMRILNSYGGSWYSGNSYYALPVTLTKANNAPSRMVAVPMGFAIALPQVARKSPSNRKASIPFLTK